MVISLLKYLSSKPNNYTLIWAHILTQSSNTGFNGDTLNMCSRFKVPRTTLRRIVEYVADKYKMDTKWTNKQLYINTKDVIGGYQVDSINDDKLNTLSDEIVSYLNKKVSGKFSSKTKSTKSLISGRLKEGYKLDDFKDVIDYLVDLWIKDPVMVKYLRPSTIFKPKFNEYLSQAHSPYRDLKQNKKTKDDRFNEAVRRATETLF